MAKETAEQKLLKIIEGGQPKKKSVASSKKARSGLTIKKINQILIVGIIVCIGLLVFEISNGTTLLNSQVEIDSSSLPPNRVSKISIPQVKSLAYYADAMSARNIFVPYESQQDNVGEPQVVTLEQRMSRYRIVGVAWLDLPESASVMVEEKDTGMTYFLREGEKIDDVTLTTIYTDRAVFRYENEEIVIKL